MKRFIITVGLLLSVLLSANVTSDVVYYTQDKDVDFAKGSIEILINTLVYSTDEELEDYCMFDHSEYITNNLCVGGIDVVSYANTILLEVTTKETAKNGYTEEQYHDAYKSAVQLLQFILIFAVDYEAPFTTKNFRKVGMINKDTTDYRFNDKENMEWSVYITQTDKIFIINIYDAVK